MPEALVFTVKFVEEEPVPLGEVTNIIPLVAPPGTVVVILDAESTVNVVATLLNLTEVVPLKFVPLIITPVPLGPVEGVKDVIIGAFEK